MLNTIFATKGEMTQAWTKDGKRLPITRCMVDQNIVLGTQKVTVKVQENSDFIQQPCLICEIGYGKKKLKNTPKPLRVQIEKSGFSFGFKQIKGVQLFLDKDQENQELPIKPGQTIELDQVLEVGDMIQVQGVSRGRGFTGVMKRHGMAGGPRTRGQSDRPRAIGSIGAHTDPGRVFPGKRMAGRFGTDNITVRNLTVVYLNSETKEVWVNGPIPGYTNSIIRITKTGQTNKIELDQQASGIELVTPVEAEPTKVETDQTKVETEPTKIEADQTKEKDTKNNEN